jgi:glycerol uptake facilitator-like aquaporin
VTTAMLVWKQITAEQWVLRIAAQMAGGVLAFPIIQGVASMYDVQIGGPTFALGECEGCLTMLEALVNECVASFILLMGIFIFCTTAIGKVYYVKQPLVAAVIRYCCVFYSKTGPAMNPALGTTWAFFEAGQVYPTESSHYIVYWLGSMLGGSLAALTWSAVDPSGPSGYLAKGKAKLE